MSGSKYFFRSEMGIMDSIIALKYHYALKCVYGSHFLNQSKDKLFLFKMVVDFLATGVEIVNCIHARRCMENSWIIFNHVKGLKDWTKMACHVYNTKYCKVFTYICCDMQFEQTLFWEI